MGIGTHAMQKKNLRGENNSTQNTEETAKRPENNRMSLSASSGSHSDDDSSSDSYDERDEINAWTSPMSDFEVSGSQPHEESNWPVACPRRVLRIPLVVAFFARVNACILLLDISIFCLYFFN